MNLPRLIEKLSQVTVPGGLAQNVFRIGTVASLVAPTLANALLVDKIREHPSVRNQALLYGLGTAAGGAAVGGAATHVAHGKLMNLVNHLAKTELLPEEFRAFFTRMPRASVALFGAGLVGGLASDIVNARVVNKVSTTPNVVLTANDILKKYSSVTKSALPVAQGMGDVIRALRKVRGVPAGKLNINDFVKRRILPVVNPDVRALEALQQLVQKLTGHAAHGDLPGAASEAYRHAPANWRALVEDELTALYRQGAPQSKLAPHEIAPDLNLNDLQSHLPHPYAHASVGNSARDRMLAMIKRQEAGK